VCDPYAYQGVHRVNKKNHALVDQVA
ncbi:MAG: hypothetical protein RL736_286, partial [Pseudomonadota bacterium]